MKITIETIEEIGRKHGVDSVKLALLKQKLQYFDRTRSIAKATEICDWLINNLDMPKVVKVRRK